MTFEIEDQPGGPGWKVECARIVYQSVGRALKCRILQLEGSEPDDKAAKVIADEVRTHRKALLQLMEYEAEFDERYSTDGTGAAAPLDLDAARDELRARISKLRQRRGDRGASGRAE
ncbi:hypothetical protein [Pontivivens nitratireducens]|uniref:hypothetical protein n=1 Tax=Pontivivens nitratireducens TaxID=2758038 RepID=UPI00197C446E|nr:hypothetical protein [Pontibrevibacter nitratireducens]